MAVFHGLADELSERVLGHAGSKFAGALGRAVRPMSFFDVSNRPLGDDYPVRRSGRRSRRVLSRDRPKANQDYPYSKPEKPTGQWNPPTKPGSAHLVHQVSDGCTIREAP